MEDLPIPKVDPLPTRIHPCPIVETILEVRFVTAEDWSVLPGLLFQQIRSRYPRKRDLPLSQFPSELRRAEPGLTYKALIQFESDKYFLQFGPRVLALMIRDAYPGWSAIYEEMSWLLDRVKECGFISEPERIGLRYVDFFQLNIFEHLIARFQIGESVILGEEMSWTKVFARGHLRARLHLNNSVVANQKRTGSVLDLDVWAGAGDFDLFTTGLERFTEAHRLNKEVFFGLMEPKFLSSLNPEYA